MKLLWVWPCFQKIKLSLLLCVVRLVYMIYIGNDTVEVCFKLNKSFSVLDLNDWINSLAHCNSIYLFQSGMVCIHQYHASIKSLNSIAVECVMSGKNYLKQNLILQRKRISDIQRNRQCFLLLLWYRLIQSII